MREIDSILEKTKFSHDFEWFFKDENYQKLELLGDAIIKLYLVESVFDKYERVGKIGEILSRAGSNRVLSGIFDDLKLNEFLWEDVPEIKDRADVIEMIVGKAYKEFGMEYAKQVCSYFLDMVIFEIKTADVGEKPPKKPQDVEVQKLKESKPKKSKIQKPEKKIVQKDVKFDLEWRKRMYPLRKKLSFKKMGQHWVCEITAGGNIIVYGTGVTKQEAGINAKENFYKSDKKLSNI